MNNNEFAAWKWAQAKNMVLSISGASMVLGLYYLGAGGFAFFGLLPFFCLSTIKQTRDGNEQS